MQLRIYSLYDKEDQSYGMIGVHSNEKEAMRVYAQFLFSQNVNLDRQMKISLPYEDFELYELASFDQDKGTIEPLDKPRKLSFRPRELLGEVLTQYEAIKTRTKKPVEETTPDNKSATNETRTKEDK